MKRMLWKVLLIVGILAFGVGADTPWPTCALTTSPQSQAAELERLLQYFVYIRALPPQTVQRERAQQMQVLAQQKSAESRLKVALLLSLPSASPQDKARGLELLREYLRAEQITPNPVRDLAYMLLTLLTDRAEPDLVPAGKKRRGVRCEEQLQVEYKSVQKLRKQIEELKNLEKTLLERDGTTQKGT